MLFYKKFINGASYTLVESIRVALLKKEQKSASSIDVDIITEILI